MPSVAATVPVDDIEVCPASAGVLDPEFDSQSQSMVYMDGAARLRVATLLGDGKVGPSGCMGSVIDQGSWGWPGNTNGYAGPEFGRSLRGLEIYYVKPLGDGVTPALARAWGGGGSGWQFEYLAGGERRTTVVPSVDVDDPDVRLMYLYRPRPESNSVPMWRDVADPAGEQAYPGLFVKSTGGAPRWIPGSRSISTSAVDSQGVRQAARYLVDTRQTEFLTNDSGNKDEVWIWAAPEFGGDLVMTTVVDACCLRVYRQLGSSWNLIKTLAAPGFTNLSSIFSPEPRVVRGKSYLALQVGNQLMDPASEIWIAAIDPAMPVLRKISESTPNVVRTEPEWFITPKGAYVYYSAQPVGTKGRALRRAAASVR